MTHLLTTLSQRSRTWARRLGASGLLALSVIGTQAQAHPLPPAQLIQILEADPENRPARWHLARALFQAERYQSARYHVARLLDTAPTAADVDVLTRALTEITTAAPLRVQLSFGVLPSTNVHRYTYNSVFRTEIGDFRPIGGGQAKAGVGLSFGGQISYGIPLASNDQLRFGLRAATRVYDASDLNSTDVTALARYDWASLGRSTGVEPFVTWTLDKHHRVEQRRIGLHWTRDWRIDPRQRVALRLTAEQRQEIGSDGNQGPFAQLRVQYRRQIGDHMSLSASAALARYAARADHLAYVERQVSLGVTRQLAYIGSLGVFGTAARREFDGLFPATSRARQDDTLRLGVSFVPPRSVRLGDWQPQVSCAGIETWSNIDLYDMRSVDCGLMFIRSF